jgi:hypothetical protein
MFQKAALQQGGGGNQQEVRLISQAALRKDSAAGCCSPFQIPFREQFAALARARGKTQSKASPRLQSDCKLRNWERYDMRSLIGRFSRAGEAERDTSSLRTDMLKLPPCLQNLFYGLDYFPNIFSEQLHFHHTQEQSRGRASHSEAIPERRFTSQKLVSWPPKKHHKPKALLLTCEALRLTALPSMS